MKKFLIHFHRILGTVLSLMFLIWFLSGMVMMYHHFPNIGTKEYKHLPALSDSLPALDMVVAKVPVSETLTALSVKTFRGQTVFDIRTDKNSYLLSADTLLSPIPYGVPYEEVEAYAREWNSADITRVDTLSRLDQWIPTGQYKRDLPIYKFYFDDPDKSYLYISSVTGGALQYVTREQRVWSWLGPIPHFMYFWQLRQHREEWSSVVSWVSGIGALMCLSGIILGVWSYYTAWKRQRRFRTPYRKFYFKWHHILGFVFGFFVMMFALSGMMSLNELPNWVVKTHDSDLQKRLNQTSDLDLSRVKADYRMLMKEFPGEAKQIDFNQYGDKPYFTVLVGEKSKNIDASQEELKDLYLSEDEVLGYLAEVSPADKSISLMTEFDDYYVGFTKRMALPVYKVVADDADKSVYYVNPTSGTTRYYNTSKRVGKWIYPAFHSLRFKFFVENQLLRDIILWTLLVGGTLVSFTGVVLGFKYICRIVSRKGKKKNSTNK